MGNQTLSADDLRWLATHGGRKAEEVNWEIGLDGRDVKYVWMSNEVGDKEKVYF